MDNKLSLLQLHLVGSRVQREVFKLGSQSYHATGYPRPCVACFCGLLVPASAEVVFVTVHDD